MDKPPISSKTLIRILVLIIILLAYVSGYYHSAYKTECQKSAYYLNQLDSLKTQPTN